MQQSPQLPGELLSHVGGAALDSILSGELFRDGVGQWVGDHRHVTGGMAQSHIGLGGIAGGLDVDHFF